MAMGMGLWSRVTTKRSWLDCIEVDRANWFLAVDVDKLCSINSEGRGIGFLFFFFFFAYSTYAGNITPKVSRSLSQIFMVALASIEIRSGQSRADKTPPLGSNFWSESGEIKLDFCWGNRFDGKLNYLMPPVSAEWTASKRGAFSNRSVNPFRIF